MVWQSGQGVLALVLPEGTELFLAANSVVMLESLAGMADAVQTALLLQQGRLLVVPAVVAAGQPPLLVSGAPGVSVAVMGGPAGVDYVPLQQIFAVDCFDGRCLLTGNRGEVALGAGEFSQVGRDGRRRDVRAREALDAALASLQAAPKPAAVNIHRFHDGVESFEAKAVPVTESMRRRVTTWLASREPAGRTALFDGIAAALADPDVDQVVVLSDGAPSAGSWFTKTDLLREVGRLQRWTRARVDVVRIGQDGVAARWRRLLEQLADVTGGVALSR